MKKTAAERLGEALQRARMYRRWTQNQLSVKVKMAARTLRRIEAGQLVPSPDTYRRLTEVLGPVDDDLALLDVLIVRASLRPELRGLGHITVRRPEAYIRLGVAASDPDKKLTPEEFEAIVRRALRQLHPIDTD